MSPIDGNQAHNRLGTASNNNLFAPRGPVDELQQMRFGEPDRDDGHGSAQ
jgi:hypothetical protein